MGYHGDFEFDFTILAENTEKAEAALLAHILSHSDETYSAYSRLGWILDEAEDKKITSLFNVAWDGVFAEEHTPAPLVALANLCDRGDIIFSDYCHKKWHSWEEDMLDVLAPFIEDGGAIKYKGEDFDCEQVWTFNGGVREEPFSAVFDKWTVDKTAEALTDAVGLLSDVSVFLGEDHCLVERIKTFMTNYQELLTEVEK